MKKRNCPICNSSQSNKLIDIDFPYNSIITGLPDTYNIVECTLCGCVYSTFIAEKKIFQSYYKNKSEYGKYNSFGGDDSPDKILQYMDILNYIQSYSNKNVSICDIGSASGGLLKFLSKNGFKNLFAIEPSSRCQSIIDNNICIINTDDIEIYSENLKSKFDFIILSHVLEHVWNAHDAINNISSYLKDDGILFLEVPNSNKYINNYDTPFHFFNYEHITHFTYNSILKLINKNNLEIIQCEEVYINKFPAIRFLIKKLENKKYYFNNNKIYDYINKSSQIDPIIQKLIETQVEIIVWGVGSSTLQLFSNGLEKCNIKHIVDSSINKQGSKMFNYIVESPSVISDDNLTILILSNVYSEQIYNQIKEMGLKNKIEFLSKQNRTEQNRTEQNRTEQNRTEQNRTEQNRTEQIIYKKVIYKLYVNNTTLNDKLQPMLQNEFVA